MIPPEEAWNRLRRHLAPLPPERLGRREAAGRMLAEDLAATVDVPPHDVSAMDGYALRGAVSPGERRPVTGVVAAGDAPGFELADGTAVRIMTGAPVPEGADRVLPVEQTDGGRDEARLDLDPGPGANIRRRGEILEEGAPLLPAGALLTPGAMALLATHGLGEVEVPRRPRVTVVTTGDEIVPPDTEPGPGQLRDSHTDFLLAAGRTLGLGFEPLGIAPDRQEDLTALIRRGVEADVLLLCGGVSKGEYDFVEGVLETLGYRMLFDAVAVKPGKPLVAAVAPDGPGDGDGSSALVFGLPGNPGSVMVCFWLFVRPVLRVMMGAEDGYWHGALEGDLAAPLPGAKDRDWFLAAGVTFEGGRLRVTPRTSKGSHDLASHAQGTALVRVPAGAEPAAAGERCEVLPLVDWRSAGRGPG